MLNIAVATPLSLAVVKHSPAKYIVLTCAILVRAGVLTIQSKFPGKLCEKGLI
jgi:hypothetical protein